MINSCFTCLSRIGRCHGVALWMEFQLTDDITVSGGLIGSINEQVSVVFELLQICTLSFFWLICHLSLYLILIGSL